jgi:hypothetical protein
MIQTELTFLAELQIVNRCKYNCTENEVLLNTA